MKKILILISISLFVLSCTNEKEQAPTTDNPNVEKFNVEYTGTTSILYTGSSIYAKFLDGNIDNQASYYTTRQDANDRSIHSYSNVATAQRSSAGNIPITVNGIDLASLNNQQATRSSVENDVYDNLFGKEVTFSFGGSSTVRSSAGEEKNSLTMYIPYVIEIKYPVAIPNALNPMCAHNAAPLAWNKDENNTNGVVVIVEWDGLMVGSDNMTKSVRAVDVVEDTGKAILNKELFADIPDLALVNVTLLRGNIDIVELEESPLKIYAASNASISIVLDKRNP